MAFASSPFRWLPIGLRTLAILIAVAAVIDPAVTSSRRGRPLLSVVATDSIRDRALFADVTRALRDDYSIVHAPLSAASGTVLVGDRRPDDIGATAAPVVVVSAQAGGPSISIRQLQAPSRASLESRVTVSLTLAIGEVPAGGSPQSVEVALAHVVRDGALVVARERIAVRRDTTITVPLTFVPSVAEPVVLQARAVIAGRADTTRSDLVVDVRATRWSVLFFDRRPSWMSTFVRRAIERDPRFAVTSRIVTSTNISRETGRPPGGLDAIASTEAFDVVVIGAPEALTARDVDGMRTLLRARGASVLVLADRAATGPVDALLGFGGWRTQPRRAVVELSAPRAGGVQREPLRLRGLSIGLPTRLPASAEPIAVLRTADIDSTKGEGERERTVVWRMPVGLGHLIVSGAFDAWRYRDSAQSTFDATWRDVVEDAAGLRQPPLDIELSRSLVEPRRRITLAVTSRDSLSDAPVRAIVRDRQAPDDPAVPIVLHGGDNPVGSFRVPPAPGTYDVLVARGGDTARAVLVVSTAVARDADQEPALLAAWAGSRGGRSVPRDARASLPQVLDELLEPTARMTTWHPMRSPWWIIPFTVALAAEWWIRRRRGQA